MKENKTYWVGRSKGGELYVFAEKPKKGTTKFIPASSIWHEIPEEYYPEITFENSPKKLVVETIMENTLIIKEKAIEIYKNSGENERNCLEKVFGKELFKPDITLRIKSINDAIKILGDTHPYVIHYYTFINSFVDTCKDRPASLVAFFILRIIVRALNEEWYPIYNHCIKRWYIGYNTLDNILYCYSKNNGTMYFPEPFVFKNEKLAKYCMTQFKDLWLDFLLKY